MTDLQKKQYWHTQNLRRQTLLAARAVIGAGGVEEDVQPQGFDVNVYVDSGTGILTDKYEYYLLRRMLINSYRYEAVNPSDKDKLFTTNKITISFNSNVLEFTSITIEDDKIMHDMEPDNIYILDPTSGTYSCVIRFYNADDEIITTKNFTIKAQ